MPGDAAWIVLGLLGLAGAALARWRPGVVVPLGAVLAPLTRTRTGRALLFACWAFVGLHLFARAGLPRP